jgi:hypothetical protein
LNLALASLSGFWALSFFQFDIVRLRPTPQTGGIGFDFGVCSPREVGKLVRDSPYTFTVGHFLAPLLRDLSDLGDPSSSYTTASIAPRWIGGQNPHPPPALFNINLRKDAEVLPPQRGGLIEHMLQKNQKKNAELFKTFQPLNVRAKHRLEVSGTDHLLTRSMSQMNGNFFTFVK